MAQERRLTRRLAGVLNARLPDLRLQEVDDPRSAKGRRWALPLVLRAILCGMMAGMRSLAAVESLTAELSGPMRRLLRIGRRVPDTTARDVLVRLNPNSVHAALVRQVHAAHRRKALLPERLPFGQVAIDGKSTTIQRTDDPHVQVPQGKDYGLMRTQTCSLVSTRPRPCIAAVPIPRETNDVGNFAPVLEVLWAAYGRLELFELVSGDAGVTSLANAQAVRDRGLHYLFSLKDNQPELLAEAKAQLDPLVPDQARTETREKRNGKTVIHRLFMTGILARFLDWSHLETVLRVDRLVIDRQSGKVENHGTRYFISSMKPCHLTPSQWLIAVRNHWGVENNNHQIIDHVFREDKQPWIVSDGRAALVVLLLRRIAYNMVTLFRSVSQRSEDRRATPWSTILRWFYNALIAARDDDITGLRPRQVAASS